MALAEGTRVFLCYDLPPPALWHERHVLARCSCGQGWHIIYTPDGDVYPEQISLENSDIAGFRIGVDGNLPYGLDATNTYRIRGLPPEPEMAQIRLDAQHAAAAMGAIPGVAQVAAPAGAPVMGQAVVGGGDAQSRVQGDGHKWIVVETEGNRRRGDEVTLDGSEIIRGSVCLKCQDQSWFAIRRLKMEDVVKYPGREASADARLMSVTFQELSRNERIWRDVAKDVHEEPFDDWGVPGPRTTRWCVQFLNRRNGGPVDHHRWWMSNLGLQSDSWGVAEHENLMKIVDKMGRYDGLDLTNLASAEMAFRRLQLIEYFYSDKGPGGGKGGGKAKEKKTDDLSYKSEAAIFSGTHREFGDTMIAPELLEYVSKEVERDAAILKQVRKAREKRAAASK